MVPMDEKQNLGLSKLPGAELEFPQPSGFGEGNYILSDGKIIQIGRFFKPEDCGTLSVVHLCLMAHGNFHRTVRQIIDTLLAKSFLRVPKSFSTVVWLISSGGFE